MSNGLIFYFGAAGAGEAYCEHSGELPDYFIDNDKNKWGGSLLGKKILEPDFLKKANVKKVVITSGYLKSIFPQLLQIGVPESKIVIPRKSWLGKHPFKTLKARVESARILSDFMNYNENFYITAVGGTALGFARDNDFILWDFDIDLFA